MRIIFHVDLDAFYAAVETLQDPSLAGKPLIIGGDPRRRGVVASANYAARAFGVRSAMTTARALRRCPQGVVRPPRHSLYRQVSARVMALLREYSPVMEQLSIDEAFLDMTDRLPNSAAALETARQLQREIQTRFGLSASVGIGSNKLVAKMAGNFDKPRGVTEVAPGAEAEFLAPMPVRALWGVGPKTAQKLAEIGAKTIGDIARLPEEDLSRMLGANGLLLWRFAHGLDARPVQTRRRARSISRETTFATDVQDAALPAEALKKMSRKLAHRLQKKDMTARTVTLKLRYGDFSTFTRSVTQATATNAAADIDRQAQFLLAKHWNRARPIRLIGLSVSRFVKGVVQPKLFDDV